MKNPVGIAARSGRLAELLGADVPLQFADNDLLTGATKCLQTAPRVDPKDLNPVGDTKCVLKIPLQSWRLARGTSPTEPYFQSSRIRRGSPIPATVPFDKSYPSALPEV